MHEQITQVLPVTLSARERAAKGRELARKRLELEEHEEKATKVKRELKAASDVLNDEIKYLAHVVDSGTEPRDVICEWHYSAASETMDLVRQDSGEVVSSRAPTKSELASLNQSRLFGREVVEYAAKNQSPTE